MDDQKLLVLDPDSGVGGPLDRGIKRRQVLTAITDAGARVRHDSGNRLLVIESSAEADETLRRELPGVRILSTDDMQASAADLDPSDQQFLDALSLRQSAEFRDRKAKQKPGETPEEQLLFTAPCTPEG